MEATPKRALIIGVTGQDGAYLARLLLRKGYEVHGTSRDAETSEFSNLKRLKIHERIHCHSTSVNDFRSVVQTIDRAMPDEIYNLSGQSSVGLSFQQPVETLESISLGTLNILESIRFLGKPIRFYNAGSSEMFGNTHGLPADEQTAFNPKSPYGIAKATAFWEVANYREAYGLYACSGILFNHESPLRHSRFVTRKIIKSVVQISQGNQSKLYLGNLDIERDWGWAPEFMEAMWRILQQETPQDFVIATGQRHSLRSFVQKAFEYFNLDWEAYTDTHPELLRPTEIMMNLGKPSKAEEVLGWKAKTSLDAIIARMIEVELGSHPIWEVE